MKKTILSAIAIIAICFASCSKSDTLPEQQAVLDNEVLAQEASVELMSAESDGILDEIFNLNIINAPTKGVWGGRLLTGNVEITMRDSASIKIITVDFGDGNTGKDGKVRSGKLISYFTFKDGKYMEQKMKYVNYKVNGYLHEGYMQKSITREVDTRTQIAIVKEDIKITFPDGTKSNHRIADMTRTYKHGDLNTNTDNIIETYGTVSFTNIKNVTSSKVIKETEKLIYKVVPGEIVQGKATMTYSTGKVITIDYGDGTADNTATLSDGTKTWTITLKK